MVKLRHWKYLIYIVMALFVLYVCVSMFYLSQKIQDGQEYAIQTSRDIRELRTRGNELAMSMPVLLASPELSAEEIKAQLDRSTKSQAKAYGRLADGFRGNPGIMKRLKNALARVAENKQNAASKFAGNISYEIAGHYFETSIAPFIEEMEAALDEANASVEDTRNEMDVLIHQRLNMIILSTLVAGIIIVITIILYDRRMASAGRELAYRDQLFKMLTRGVDEIFIVAVNATQFEYVSPNSDRILGLNPATLLINPSELYEALEPADAQWLKKALDSPPPDGARLEQDLTDISGSRFFYARVYCIEVPATDQKRFIIVINDQTAARLHQQALSDALENAHAASAAKNTFLSHLSHEIRTPMNAIIGMTTIAQSRLGDPARVEDCLAKISDSSHHLLGLINDMLDMSKIEAGKLSICNEQFNLHQLIDNVLSIARPEAQLRKQNFNVLLENVDEEDLIGDAMRVKQILLNILSNAIKFTPDGGSITLKLEQARKSASGVRLHFVVIDTGIGISREFLEKIYLPFEQAYCSSTSKYGGTGLGMSITANLVAMMGGSIHIESVEGEGTTVFVEIPFGLSQKAVQQPHKLPPLKIIVVDEDKITCDHAALLLSRMGMLAVSDTSVDGAFERIRKAREAGEPFQVCILSWNMPGKSAAELIEKLRAEPGPEPIVFISTYDRGLIEQDAARLGISNFIAKPLFVSTLYDSLMSAARKLDYGEAAPAAEAAPAGQSYNFAGNRVLLVEDNEFNREIGQEFLEMANIEVDNAANGKEAVDKFINSAPGTYDLILMDVQMPIMNGHEATRLIRSSTHPDSRNIGIIALTANAFNDDITKATAAGMNAHLSKPIEVDGLYELMARFLKPKA